MRVGSLIPAIFAPFAHYIFPNFTRKATILAYCHYVEACVTLEYSALHRAQVDSVIDR